MNGDSGKPAASDYNTEVAARLHRGHQLICADGKGEPAATAGVNQR